MTEPDQDESRRQRIAWEARQKPWNDFDPATDVSPSDYEDLEDDEEGEEDDEEGA